MQGFSALLAGPIILGAAILIGVVAANPASARDDGRYADEPLHAWFDSLASNKGLCCSFADGVSVSDPDWDTDGGQYRVRLNGEWIVVPNDALVAGPNRFGQAVVWPYVDPDGVTKIRCFIPGAGL
jgi:hypothetical protein